MRPIAIFKTGGFVLANGGVDGSGPVPVTALLADSEDGGIEEARGLGGVVIILPSSAIVLDSDSEEDEDGGVAPCNGKLCLVSDIIEMRPVAISGVLVSGGPVTNGVENGPVPVWEVGRSVCAMVAVVLPALSMRYVVSSSHGCPSTSPISMIFVPALEKIVAVTMLTQTWKIDGE